jgi:hypothetical protein
LKKKFFLWWAESKSMESSEIAVLAMCACVAACVFVSCAIEHALCARRPRASDTTTTAALLERGGVHGVQ